MPDWRLTGPVRRWGKCVLASNGTGTIVLEVYSANHKFEIATVVVKAQGATPALFPQVTLYNGLNQADASSAGGSWLGGQVTFRGKIIMDNADSLTVGFASGAAGTVMTAIAEGDSYLWR